MHTIESTEQKPELTVRLNGYLLRSDLLFETASAYVAKHPERALQLVRWARSGRAELKRGLANATSIDVTTLPYDQQVIADVRRAREDGRRIVLQTASDPLLAERISAHLGLFDEVVTFDAASQHRDRAADGHGAVYISRPERPRDLRTRITTLRRALRPSIVGQEPADLRAVRALVQLAVTAVRDQRGDRVRGLRSRTSSVYLLNDLVDVGDDRHHHRKRTRPFASGELDLRTGWLLWPALLLVAFATALLLLPPLFTLCLAGYFVTTVSYFLLPQTARDLRRRHARGPLHRAHRRGRGCRLGRAVVLAPGVLALHLPEPRVIKRFSELRLAGQTQQRNETLRGAATCLGTPSWCRASGSRRLRRRRRLRAVHQRRPHRAPLLHAAVPLARRTAAAVLDLRAWMITHRGDMHDDPVVFAIKDRVSWIVVALCAVVFALGKLVG